LNTSTSSLAAATSVRIRPTGTGSAPWSVLAWLVLGLSLMGAQCPEEEEEDDTTEDDDDASADDDDEMPADCDPATEVRFFDQTVIPDGGTVAASEGLVVGNDRVYGFDIVVPTESLSLFQLYDVIATPQDSFAGSPGFITVTPLDGNVVRVSAPTRLDFPEQLPHFDVLLELEGCNEPFHTILIRPPPTVCAPTTTVFFEGVAIDSGSDIDALSVEDDDDDGSIDIEIEVQNDDLTEPLLPPTLGLIEGKKTDSLELDSAPVDPIEPGASGSYQVDVLPAGKDDGTFSFTLTAEGCDDPFFEADVTVPGVEGIDIDGDGVNVELDCDDNDPLTFPGAFETCDGIDNDCDNVVPPVEVDGDVDDFPPCAGDCDDAEPDAFPGADEFCDDLDFNCDGNEDAVDPATGATSFTESERTVQSVALPGTITSTLTVVDTGTLHDLNVVVRAHGLDLEFTEIVVTSPLGTPVTLVSPSLIAGDSLGTTFFDDESPLTLAASSSPYTAHHQPIGELVAFNGEDPLGVWTLTITSSAALIGPAVLELWNVHGTLSPPDDFDLDGFIDSCGDCDETDVETFPGAFEICDGIDNNCDGVVPADEEDNDGDTLPDCSPEACEDGVDNNGDGNTDCDDPICLAVPACLMGDDDDATEDPPDLEPDLGDVDGLAVVGTTAGVTRTESFGVGNDGTADLVISSIVIGNLNNCTANPVAPVPGVIAPGGSEPFLAAVTPSAAGPFSFDITIESNDPDESPATFLAAGEASAVPEPEITVTRLSDMPDMGVDDLGLLDARELTEIEWTITNDGQADLTLAFPVISNQLGVTVTEIFAPASVVPAWPATNNSTVYSVLVAPQVGAFSFEVGLANNDPDETFFQFTVTGEGHGPNIVVPSTLHLGEVQHDEVVPASFELSNTGAFPLTVTAITSSIANTSAGAIVIVTPTPFTVPPGGTVVVEITVTSFSSVDTSSMEFEIAVASDDPDDPIATVEGTAIVNRGEIAVVLLAGQVNYEETLTYTWDEVLRVGQPTVLEYQIENTGPGILTVDSITVANPLDCTAVISPALSQNPLQPGDTATFGLEVTAQDAATWSVGVDIASDAHNPLFGFDFTQQGTQTNPRIRLDRGANVYFDGDDDPVGSQDTGQPVELQYDVLNLSFLPIALGPFSVASTDNASATISAPSSSPVGPEGTETFDVTVTRPPPAPSRSSSCWRTTPTCIPCSPSPSAARASCPSRCARTGSTTTATA
jgi:hypothetical protein